MFFGMNVKIIFGCIFDFLRMKKPFLYLFLFLIGTSAFRAGAQSQFSGWMAVFNTFKTGKKTSIHLDMQWRSSDQLEHIQTLLFRGGLNFHLNKRLTATGGYAFTYNRRNVNDVSGYAPEHRIWEQLMYSHRIKTISISHRLRLEQRFIGQTVLQNDELKADGYGYANRIRYFVRNIIPLRGQTTFTRGLFAALQDEVFANFGNDEYTNGEFFDQNRLYLAVGYRLNTLFDIEAGYMNQYTNGRNNTFTNNHILQVAGYLRL